MEYNPDSSTPAKLVRYRGYWYAYWRDDGRPIRRSLGTSDAGEARRVFQRFLGDIDLRRNSNLHTIEEIWNARRKALGARRLASNMAYSGVAILPFFGSLSPQSLSKCLLEEYISLRQEKGRKPGTIWTELSHLRMALRWARKENLIQDYPSISLPTASPPRTFYLTKKNIHELLSGTTLPHLRLFIVLAIATGARSGALFELTWDRVDLQTKRIYLKATDNIHQKNRAIVPINESLEKELLVAKSLATTPWVLEFRGKQIRTVRKALKRLANSKGISDVSAHVFRHSAAVWMAEAGVSMEEIAQYLGHKDIQVTRSVYARYSPDYLSKAAKALNI